MIRMLLAITSFRIDKTDTKNKTDGKKGINNSGAEVYFNSSGAEDICINMDLIRLEVAKLDDYAHAKDRKKFNIVALGSHTGNKLNADIDFPAFKPLFLV